MQFVQDNKATEQGLTREEFEDLLFVLGPVYTRRLRRPAGAGLVIYYDHDTPVAWHRGTEGYMPPFMQQWGS
jgi:hypothetical protein